jgi:thymidine kinase
MITGVSGGRDRRGLRPVAELVFFTGTMDCGKSTLALQMDHNARQRGLAGRLFTCHDRAGSATLSSRLGLTVPAVEVRPDLDLQRLVVSEMTAGSRIDYLICDEAQFYTADQVEQLGRVVDELSVDVFAYGILTDFRTELFEGSRRLVELADRVETLQVQALCWCGRRATHNARTVQGVMVTEGAQVVVGDTEEERALDVGYEVLCRRHHRRRVTARVGSRGFLSPDVLPFGSGN